MENIQKKQHFQGRRRLYKNRAEILAFAKKNNVPEAVQKYGVSVGSIYDWSRLDASELDDKRDIFLARLRALADADPYLTVKSAAKKLGCTEYMVRSVAKEFGVTLHSFVFDSDDVKAVIAYFDGNRQATLWDAVRDLNMPINRIRHILSVSGYQRARSYRGGLSKLDLGEVLDYLRSHPHASLRELGRAFDVSRQGVLNFLKKNGVSRGERGHWDSEKRVATETAAFARIAEAAASGEWCSLSELARLSGQPISRAKKYAALNGLKSEKPRVKIAKEDVVSALVSCPTYKALADHFGVSYMTVARLLKRYGLQRREREK